MFKTGKHKILSVLLLPICLNLSPSFAQSRSVDLQRVDGSVAAKTEYHGDHFFGATGQTVKLYRKKDVYALARNRSVSSEATLNRIVSAGSGSWVNVSKHNLPGARVVRSNSHALKKGFAAISHSKPMTELQPVFTTASGKGDLLLLDKITLSMANVDDVTDGLDLLSKKYKLTVLRRLNVSGYVYSVQPQKTLSVDQQFALVRGMAQESSVQWAEPQFYMQAQREQVSLMSPPNDPLYAQQWHLNNSGLFGSRCDADCDVPEAWALDNGTGPATGAGITVAVIDDGVQTNHPDLNVDTVNGKDFVDDGNDSNVCGHDGENGPDDDPNPSPDINCIVSGDQLQADNHGTAVAGIIAAKDDDLGAVGVAFNSAILPVRALSEYDVANLVSNSPLCDRLAEAVEYAAQKAHVINLSWSLPINCNALTTAIENATNGDVTVGLGSLRSGGSPVIAASGNSASGWVKVTTQVRAGEHAYEWRYLRSDFPSLDVASIDETVRVDDITWPDGTIESFESLNDVNSGDFSTDWELNQCNVGCDGETGELKPIWDIQTDAEFARSGVKSAQLNAASGSIEEHFCGNSYLHTLRNDQAGEMSFWVWVSANTQDGFDKFEFLVDGNEIISYGDLAAFGFVSDDVAYPANLSNASSSTEAGLIAVGASSSGDLTGNITAPESAEYRAPYSQFGDTLDVVAPGGAQHLGITTTDRFSGQVPDTLGLNTSTSLNELSDTQYTQKFTGTSAAAATVSGIAAAIIATDGSLSAQEVKDLIKDNADQIGNTPFSAGRNNQVGHGRVNMYKALRAARSETVDEPSVGCFPQVFGYQVANDLLLSRYAPQSSAMCPALGPLPEPDEVCYVVPLKNDKQVVFCL